MTEFQFYCGNVLSINGEKTKAIKHNVNIADF